MTNKMTSTHVAALGFIQKKDKDCVRYGGVSNESSDQVNPHCATLHAATYLMHSTYTGLPIHGRIHCFQS